MDAQNKAFILFSKENNTYQMFTEELDKNGIPPSQSRISLIVTAIRVEKLEGISLRDIRKEGLSMMERYPNGLPTAFKKKWNSEHEEGEKFDEVKYVFVYDIVIKDTSCLLYL